MTEIDAGHLFSGACIGAQCQKLPDGSKVTIEVVE